MSKYFKIAVLIILVIFIVIAILIGPTIWKLLSPSSKPKPISQDKINFSISSWEIAWLPKFHKVFAKKQGVKNASGQFFWESKNGHGITVAYDGNISTVYGQYLNGDQAYEYHEIGNLVKNGSKIQLNFLPGSSFTYTPRNFDFGDVVSVTIPIETKATFTKPLPTN